MLVVEADFGNKDGLLRPGTFARSDIVLTEDEPATAVPKDALITFAGIEKIFLVKGGKAVEKNIATGRRAEGFIEIIGGVKPGDLVVVNPGSLQNGQPVTLDAPVKTAPVGSKKPKETTDSSQQKSSSANGSSTAQ